MLYVLCYVVVGIIITQWACIITDTELNFVNTLLMVSIWPVTLGTMILAWVSGFIEGRKD